MQDLPNFPGVPENIYEYQNNFNYQLWTEDTTVTLCNVPWDMSYRDIVKFANDAERDAYFNGLKNSLPFQLTTKVILKYGDPVMIPKPFNSANGYNYLHVHQPLFPVPGEEPGARTDYFYFITSMDYIAPNTTRLNVQLDVWTTYGNSVEFGNCYLERGHYAMQQLPAPSDYLSSPISNPVAVLPEGLEIGNDYEIVNIKHDSWMTSGNPLYVIISSTADLTLQNWGDINDPELATAKGSIINDVPSGSEVYAIDASHFESFMNAISQFPWVSQCIQIITVGSARFLQFGDSITIRGIPARKLSASSYGGNTVNYAINVDSWYIPDRYKNLTKFYTYPYSAIELTDNSGQAIVYKPDAMQLSSDGYAFFTMGLDTPPFSEYVMFPIRYNGRESGGDTSFTAYKMSGQSQVINMECGEFMDAALVFSNFPRFSVVNDSYALTIASSARSRAYAYSNAGWSRDKAMMANQLGYDQSSATLQNALMNSGAGIQANTAQNDVRNMTALAGGLQSAANSLASGNVVSSALGIANAAASTTIQYTANNRSTEISNMLASQTATNNYNTGKYVADTNLSYGNFAAQGDYQQAIAAINAQVQDAEVIAPSISGNAGGDAFMIAKGYFGVTLKIKRIKDAFLRTVGEYWLRYGYAYNGFVNVPVSLMCCKNFTYWKMTQCYIFSSSVPEEYRQTIRGIFEKGVTVWADPAKMGRIDVADNEVIR